MFVVVKVAVVVAAMTVVAVLVVKVLVEATVVFKMALELLIIEAWADVVVTGTMVALKFVVPGSCLVELMSDVIVKALVNGIGLEVLADVNVNVSTAMMTAFEFTISVP